MEGRDSSSSASSTATAVRDGSSCTVADDIIFSENVALAKDSALHFQSRKFAECVEVLKQLLQKKPDDPKVLHNIAIAEYFRDGCPDPKRLLEVLGNVKKRSDELARASSEQLEPVGNAGNKSTLGSKGSNASAHQLSTNSMSVVYTDEFDTSVTTLNIAIVWYHLHEYAKVLSVLEPLYQNIEPIDETTALHICLLLLDAALASHNATKSADVLHHLEKAFGVGCMSHSDNGTAQQQAASLIAKSSSVPCNSSAADASGSELAAGGNSSESPLSRTLSDETLDYEAMLLDIGGPTLTRPTGASANDLSRVPVDKSFSTNELKLKIQLYKVQFLLLTRNLKLAKREVKLAMNISRGIDSSMALLLKSQLEYARGNHRKAIKLLMAANNCTDTAFSSIFNNNLGCIYYQLGKYHTMSLLFSNALTSCSSLRMDKRQRVSIFSQDSSHLILYNCGVQYLACGKPMLAARCFQKSSVVFHKRPLLWLRLGECCLVALEKGLIKSNRATSGRSEVQVHVVGKGKWRHLVVEDGVQGDGFVDSFKTDDALSNEEQLKLSIPLARQCLLNALHLLNSSGLNHSKSGVPSNTASDENESSDLSFSKNSKHKNLLKIDSKAFQLSAGLGQFSSNGDAKEQKGGTSQELLQSSLSCYEEMCMKENQLIKQAVLVNLAYVELESDNPIKALSFANSLLELPECSRIYIFLSHLYAAEALCLLNRPKEAASRLSIYLSGGDNVELPFSHEDCEKWRMDKTDDCEELNGGSAAAKNSLPKEAENIVFLKPEEARAAIYANFAAMSAMQGDLEQAHTMITRALSVSSNSPEATITGIYVDLMLGKPQEALAKLKSCSRIRFLPNGMNPNRSS